MYVWLLRDEGRGYGWVVCLLFAVCAALRLARFNSLLDDDRPKPWAKGFFTGVPTPAGGLMVTAPLLLTNRLGDDGFWAEPWVVSIWMVLIGLLMVSRVPTIALKSVRLPPQLIVPMLILLVLGGAALFYEPELVTVIGMVVYLLHIPYAGWKYNHLKNHPELWRTAGRGPPPVQPPGADADSAPAAGRRANAGRVAGPAPARGRGRAATAERLAPRTVTGHPTVSDRPFVENAELRNRPTVALRT